MYLSGELETAEWEWSRDQGGGLVGMESLRLVWGNGSRVITGTEGVALCVWRPLKHSIESNSLIFMELVRDTLLNLG